MEETEDPTCWIEARGEDEGIPWIIYRNRDGERWIIRGCCIACGACEPESRADRIWTGIPVGRPGACLDPRFGTRKDEPVRPELPLKLPACTLTGEYLEPDGLKTVSQGFQRDEPAFDRG